jgi:hypothetical protein
MWISDSGTDRVYKYTAAVGRNSGSQIASANFALAGSLDGPNAGGEDAFLAKYDTAGNLLWIRQFGTTGKDREGDVSADDMGNVYISGFSFGSLGGPHAGPADGYVAKYDADGNQQWIRQLGGPEGDALNAVVVDPLGNIYASGNTFGSLGGGNAGSDDAILTKIDAAGNYQWTAQLGASGSERSEGVAVDGQGNVYVSGKTYGILGGASPGTPNVFATKCDAGGNLLWTLQLRSSAVEDDGYLSALHLGNIYIAGTTNGSWGGPNAGSNDAILIKLSPPAGLRSGPSIDFTSEAKSIEVARTLREDPRLTSSSAAAVRTTWHGGEPMSGSARHRGAVDDLAAGNVASAREQFSAAFDPMQQNTREKQTV